MDVSAANLTAIFTSFDLSFQRGFEKAPSYYDKICTVVPSASRQNFYPWLGRTTGFREWVGDRVLQALTTYGYTLVNRKFEDSVAIARDDIEDDLWGVYGPIMEKLGWDAAVFPNILIFGMLKAAATGAPATIGKISVPIPVGFDGLNFFANNHPYGPLNAPTGTYSNVITTGSGANWFLLDCGRPIRPVLYQERRKPAVTRMNTLTDERVWNQDEFRYGVDLRANAGVTFPQLALMSNTDLSNPANFGAAIAQMRTIKTDDGLPFGSWDSPSTDRYLCVPPSLEEVARQLLHGDFGAINVAGAVGAIPGANIYKGECQLIVSPYLA
jgi:phage major head subunit gpT-like protein